MPARPCRCGRLAPNRVIDLYVGHAGRLPTKPREQADHRRIVSRFANLGVLALSVYQDRGNPRALELGYQPGDRGRLAATGGPQHPNMPRQHGFASCGYLHLHVLKSNCGTQRDVADKAEHHTRLLVAEYEDWAVGQRAEARRFESALHLLAEDFDLDTAMVARHEHGPAYRDCRNNRSIRLQAIRLGERSSDHRTEILPAVPALVDRAALDPYK